jgi:hypothetical protein
MKRNIAKAGKPAAVKAGTPAAAKTALLLLAVVLAASTAFTGCAWITDLFQGDIDVAGTWSYTNDWGTVTWTITNDTFDDGYESGEILSYSNADQYFIYQVTQGSNDYDEGKFLKVFWEDLDPNADVKVKMSGVYRSTADTDGSWFWATLEEAEATSAASVVFWSEFTGYTAP